MERGATSVSAWNWLARGVACDRTRCGASLRRNREASMNENCYARCVVSAVGLLERGQECGESLRFGRGVGIAGPQRREDAVDLTVEDGPAGVVQGLQSRLVVVPRGFEVLDPRRRATLVAGLDLGKRVLR